MAQQFANAKLALGFLAGSLPSLFLATAHNIVALSFIGLNFEQPIWRG